MRRVRHAGLFPVLGFLLLGSAGAHAGTLTIAEWSQVTQGVPITRSFGQLGAAGSSTAASIAIDLSFPFFGTTVFVPGSAVSISPSRSPRAARKPSRRRRAWAAERRASRAR